MTSYAYTAYGELMPNSPEPNVYGYNAEATDFSIGIQYLRARYYDTTLSRFFQEDDYRGSYVNPISMNRYAYTYNNPVMGIDPSGYDYVIYDPDKAEHDFATTDDFLKYKQELLTSLATNTVDLHNLKIKNSYFEKVEKLKFWAGLFETFYGNDVIEKNKVRQYVLHNYIWKGYKGTVEDIITNQVDGLSESILSLLKSSDFKELNDEIDRINEEIEMLNTIASNWDTYVAERTEALGSNNDEPAVEAIEPENDGNKQNDSGPTCNTVSDLSEEAVIHLLTEIMNEVGNDRTPYTEDSKADWCGFFVRECFEKYIPDLYKFYPQSSTRKYYNNVDPELRTSAVEGYRPYSGDVFFFFTDDDNDGNADEDTLSHIGLVIGSDDKHMYTIEGNVNGVVTLGKREYKDVEDLYFIMNNAGLLNAIDYDKDLFKELPNY